MKLNIRSFILLSIYVTAGLIVVFLCMTYFPKSTLANRDDLSVNNTEQLVTLRGKLVLKLFPGPPEYSSVEEGDRADYCWLLELDQSSPFTLAQKISAVESAYGEILLVLDEYTEHFCQKHRNETILSEGYLFPAHTAHHYTSLLMDVKRCWSERE